ncbi:MAG: alpha-amylase family glycosyl hydrolase [Spirochaetota bacterium]
MSLPELWRDSVFYHIYTLGFCGAPVRNDFSSPAVPRLEAVAEAAGHIRELGCTAVYLGPLFESTSHGYDTVDHYHVDRRLGNNDTLRGVVRRLHKQGLRVVLDGVFNHTGRDHFAFYDLRQRGAASAYCDWFKGVDFSSDNRFGDGFTYHAWEGHEELPELNLESPEVREYLFGAVEQMIDDFDIDGLRLDVAYALPADFLRELGELTVERAAARRKDRAEAAGSGELRADEFFLLGEVIHGEYLRFAAETGLHSVTNYETYKALWSAHNDGNYFELAHSLERNCGPELYNFADNHDVDRVASKLEDPRHLFPLYALLFTIPGIPSVYYGSEFAIEGRRGAHSDAALRPVWNEVLRRREVAAEASKGGDQPAAGLCAFIAELAEVRRRSTALQAGNYRPLYLDHHVIAFERMTEDERVLVVASSLCEQTTISIPVESDSSAAEDMFRPGTFFPVKDGALELSLPAYGSAVFRLYIIGEQ